MLRTALQPRWLGLFLIFVMICTGFGWLGWWQLGVAAARGAAKYRVELASRPIAPLATVLQPQQPFPVAADARSVFVDGKFDPRKQLLIQGRLQRGRPGWWVVGALKTELGWLAVVRGWTANPELLPAKQSSDRIRVLGVLQPDEAPKPPGPEFRADQIASVDAAELANRWGTPLFNAYLIASAETRLDRGGSAGLPGTAAGLPGTQWVPPPGPQKPGLSWRNAAYAVQWWIFAGFTLVLWWKMVRQAAAIGPNERESR